MDFQGSRANSDEGLVQVRELGEWLGLGESSAQHLRSQCSPLGVYCGLLGRQDGNSGQVITRPELEVKTSTYGGKDHPYRMGRALFTQPA
jgi:hypothetical protein